jgi:uncharacterized oxidoreductase
VLFNIEMFGGIEHFLFESGKLTDYVRACPTAPGVKGITLPGDPERLTRIQRLKEGITIPIGTWELLVKEADRLQVPLI